MPIVRSKSVNAKGAQLDISYQRIVRTASFSFLGGEPLSGGTNDEEILERKQRAEYLITILDKIKAAVD